MNYVHLALVLSSLLAACGQERKGQGPESRPDDPPVREMAVREMAVREIKVPYLGSAPASRPIVEPPAGKPLPAAAMAAPLVDEQGRQRSLASEEGKVRVLSFFFRCCSVATMCPQLTTTLSDSTGRLSAEDRSQVRGFLVSFDPERDTPERLKTYGEDIGANPDVLSLLTGKIEDIRKLTDACGVNFTPGENKDIAHNMRTVVLDKRGNVAAVFRGSDFEAGELLAAIRAAVRGEKPAKDKTEK